jgi:hypothetical protein
MKTNFFNKISEFLIKFMENDQGFLFPFQGIYVRNGEMFKISQMRG